MPSGRKSATKKKRNGGGFGKSLMGKASRAEFHAQIQPDYTRVITQADEQKVTSITDFIARNKEVSTLETNDLEDYFEMVLAQQANYKVSFRNDKPVEIDEDPSGILPVPIRPFAFREPLSRVLTFADYLVQFAAAFVQAPTEFINFGPESEGEEAEEDEGSTDEEVSVEGEEPAKRADADAEPEVDEAGLPPIDLYDIPDGAEEPVELTLEQKLEVLRTAEPQVLFSAIYHFFLSRESVQELAPLLTKEGIELREYAAFNQWRLALHRHGDESEKRTVTPYEKNLMYWRQLWRTVEKSDVVLQLVDSRNPLLFWSQALNELIHAQNKESMLVLNKSDYLSPQQRRAWKAYFDNEKVEHLMYSAMRELQRQGDAEQTGKLDEFLSIDPSHDWEHVLTVEQLQSTLEAKAQQILETKKQQYSQVEPLYKAMETSLSRFAPIHKAFFEFLAHRACAAVGGRERMAPRKNFKLLEALIGPLLNAERRIVIGTIGFPNVGKSSLINSIMKGTARVGVSRTPGKTRHIQTLDIPDSKLLTVCDCPGLVLPNRAASKEDLVINGIMNASTYRGSIVRAVDCLLVRIWDQIAEVYGVKQALQKLRESCTAQELTEEAVKLIAASRGIYAGGKGGQPDVQKMSRMLIQQYLDGRVMSYCEPCPLQDAEEWAAEERRKWESRWAHSHMRRAEQTVLQKGVREKAPPKQKSAHGRFSRTSKFVDA